MTATSSSSPGVKAGKHAFFEMVGRLRLTMSSGALGLSSTLARAALRSTHASTRAPDPRPKPMAAVNGDRTRPGGVAAKEGWRWRNDLAVDNRVVQ
ncbi:MAG: hypothetical protein R2932_08545 [Caldilineaceae bacterium]